MTVLYGLTQADDRSNHSYSWQFDYRQTLLRNAALSVGYVNEGHLIDHHRDGIEVQLWAVTPRWRDRVSAAIGIGPYVYFDTQPADADPWFRDHHGLGTASARFTPPRSAATSEGTGMRARIFRKFAHRATSIRAHS